MNRLPKSHRTLAAVIILLAAVAGGCSSDTETGVDQSSGGPGASRGEHDRDGGRRGEEGRGEHARDDNGGYSEEGEESDAELTLDESYDKIRNGARLVLAYDAESNLFQGTVENTTDKTLDQVRVEVHLSNGKELGPTTPADLEPGEKKDVRLTAESKDFDGWTAHPEVGSGEHGHGEEDGEHGREGRGEHDGDGREHAEEGRGEHE
jgi:hypothetical protein